MMGGSGEGGGQSGCRTCEGKRKKKGIRTVESRARTFTLCLCGLGEPAKLPLLLLGEVSQRDPLVLTNMQFTQADSRGSSESVTQRRRKKGGGGGKGERGANGKGERERAAIQTTVEKQQHYKCVQQRVKKPPGKAGKI